MLASETSSQVVTGFSDTFTQGALNNAYPLANAALGEDGGASVPPVVLCNMLFPSCFLNTPKPEWASQEYRVSRKFRIQRIDCKSNVKPEMETCPATIPLHSFR